MYQNPNTPNYPNSNLYSPKSFILPKTPSPQKTIQKTLTVNLPKTKQQQNTPKSKNS